MSELPGDQSRGDASDMPGMPEAVDHNDANADREYQAVVARYDGTDFGDLDHALLEYGSAMRWTTRTIELVKQHVNGELLQEPDMSPWDFVSMALNGRASVGIFLFNQPDTDRSLARRGFRSMVKGLCFAEATDAALRCANAIADEQIRQTCTLQIAQTLAKSGRAVDAVDLIDRLEVSVDPQLYVIFGVLDAIAAGDPLALDATVGVRDPVSGRMLESAIVRANIDAGMRANGLDQQPSFRYLTPSDVANLSKQQMFRWYGMRADHDRLKVMVYSDPLYDDVRRPLLHNIGIGAGINCNEALALIIMNEALPDDQFVFLRGYQLGLARSLSRIARLKSAESAQ